MTKIDIFSGFLGAGKTTLIKKLIAEAYAGEKLVLIENEFGEIGIDGGFMRDAGIEITEMNSGCICCSLVGDFGRALGEVLTKFSPDRILIEPSGVGKLSDVIRAVMGVESENAQLNCFTTVVDAGKCKMYMKNFGEFFGDQIKSAGCIILSHTDRVSDSRLAECLSILREHNPTATVVTTPWSELDGRAILSAMEKTSTLAAELDKLSRETEHHHHHEHGEECSCGHHHHGHEHGEKCSCGHHHHEHEHGEECSCGCGEHGHHHHHADDVFESWGVETTKKFTTDAIRAVLEAFDEGECGMILRAKGIVAAENGGWIHFDYVPEGIDVREGSADVTGRLCVIGAGLDREAIAAAFGVC